jgi:hypothetical protein
MDRTPPIEVRRKLRKEVGFGCPVPGCGNPYLTWHHFDPPWREFEHHNPAGMIALCQDHHTQADAGAFTKEQLFGFKANALQENIKGKFNWMRKILIYASGGNFFLDPYIILQYKSQPIIWLTRDEELNFLLNINFITSTGESRFKIEENFWNIIEQPLDIDCPPSGRQLDVKYSNGDRIQIVFSDFENKTEFEKKFNCKVPNDAPFEFPITVVWVYFKDSQAGVEFKTKATISGVTIQGYWARAPVIFNI